MLLAMARQTLRRRLASLPVLQAPSTLNGSARKPRRWPGHMSQHHVMMGPGVR